MWDRDFCQWRIKKSEKGAECPMGTFQLYIFESVQNSAYNFFTLNFSTFFTFKGGGVGGQAHGPPKYVNT